MHISLCNHIFFFFFKFQYNFKDNTACVTFPDFSFHGHVQYTLFKDKILKQCIIKHCRCIFLLWNWWKGSIACTRKQQPRFYWRCSSVVLNDATPLTPTSAWAELPFSNVNNIHVHSMIPEDQKNMTTQWCSTGRLFTAATQAPNTSCSK